MEINQSDDNSESLSASIQEVSASIQEELSKLPPLSRNRCIYRVPKRLRRLNEHAYTPVVVSIGPYHHKDERLFPMEVHKLRYLDYFLHDPKNNADLDTLLRIVKDRESTIRECYADAMIIELSSDEFSRMVLIDSIFIIMILISWKGEYGSMGDDQIHGRPFIGHEVFRDIKLAENQLPFFILKDLYQNAFEPDVNDMPSFTDIACEFFKVNKTRIPINAETGETTCCHILELLQTPYLPSGWREPEEEQLNSDKKKLNLDETTITCGNITSLYEAGIKFRSTCTFDSLLDIRFDKDKDMLTIPKLLVEDGTEYQFRNLIAFEQCHTINYCVSDYIFFIDCLINTQRDVELLVEAGIIDNWLGSNKQVSKLVNSLGKNVITTSHHYKFVGLTKQLNSYCEKPWNSHRAILKHTYFRHPWAVISVIYAAIILILTLIQAVTGIVSALKK